jgi:hypothetical protein
VSIKTVTSTTYRNSSFLSQVTNHYHYQKAYHKQLLSICILTHMFLIALLLSHYSYMFIIFTSRILHPFLLKPIHATCAVHYILPTLSFLTIRDKQFKQRSLSLVTSSVSLNYTSLQVSIN